MADNRIKGADIFNNAAIKRSMETFKRYMNEAKTSVELLKKEIMELNALMTSKTVSRYTASLRTMAGQASRTAASVGKVKTQVTQLNTQLLAQKKRIDALTTANKKLRTAQGAGSSGKSSGGGLMTLGGMSTSAIIAAGYAVLRLGKNVYSTMKQLDSLDLVLKNITEDTYQVAYSMQFLDDISEKFGLNILKTSQKFATFRASAKESNFTLNETMQIFEQFSAAGANMGKSAEEMDRIFLALEQMMSKGTVSSEELRRQLGEVLPGAVSIMAKSMGVSTAELQDMLKAGEVLTYEVLPDFARAIVDSYGVDVSADVNTIVAEQNRLSTAWTEFISSVTEAEGPFDSAVKGMLSSMTGMVEGMTSNFSALDLALEQSSFWQWYKGGWKKAASFTKAAWDFVIGDAISTTADYFLGDARAQIAEEDVEEYMKEAMTRIGSIMGKYVEASKGLGGTPNSMAYFLGISESGDTAAMDDAIDRMDMIIKQWVELNKVKKEGNDEDKKAAKQKLPRFSDLFPNEVATQTMEEYIKLRSEQYDKILTLEEAGETERAAALREQYGVVERDLRKHLMALGDTITDITPEEYAIIIDRIAKEYGEIVSQAQKTFKDIVIDGGSYEEGAPGNLKESGGVGAFGAFWDWDEQSIYQKADLLLNTAANFYDQLSAIQNKAYENQMELIEQAQDRQNSYYEDKMTLAGDDADLQDKIRIQQADADEKLDKKRRKLEYEQAKAAKQQAITQSIINTALGVTSALSLPPPFSFILAGIVATLGAIETAVISAQKIPAYAKGTNYHAGGLAVLGDGGRAEIAMQPDGSSIISGASDEIHNLQRGTKVIPDARKFIQTEVVSSILALEERREGAMIERVVDSVIEGFSKARINNRTNVTVKNGINHELWKNSLIN